MDKVVHLREEALPSIVAWHSVARRDRRETGRHSRCATLPTVKLVIWIQSLKTHADVLSDFSDLQRLIGSRWEDLEQQGPNSLRLRFC